MHDFSLKPVREQRPPPAARLHRDTLLRLFEAAPNPYLVLCPDAPRFTIAAVSDAYLAATGTARGELLGRGVFEIFPANPGDPADDGARALANSLARVLATRETDVMGVQRYDIPGRHGGGRGGFRMRYWSPRNVPVPAPDGAVELILHHVEDVTDLALMRHRADLAETEVMRRDAEAERFNREMGATNAALREAEDHLRHVVELNPQIPWTADPTGNVTGFSERWLQVTGLSREEALGEGWVRVPHPEDLPAMGAAWRRAVATGEPYDAEVRLRMADGRYRWWRIRAFPRRDAKGRVLRWYGTTEDVHEKRTAEDALRGERERLAALVAQAAVGIAETDADGRLVLVNGALCDILGRPEAEVLGRSVEDLARREGAEAARRARAVEARVLGAGEPAFAEGRHLRPDGTAVWVAVHAGPVRDASGSVRGGVAVVVDTTARRNAEQRQALLVAELNHRAKNMLAVVQSVAAQTLRGTADEPERFARHFSARLQALARAHDLLTKTAWTKAGFGDAVRAALAPWLAEEGGARVEVAAAPDGMDAPVGPQQVQALVLALHELATNAAKHGALSRPGGRVAVSCRTGPDGAAALTWTETGGPPVPGPPARPGFGTRLLERSLASDLGPGSAVSLVFDPAGLRAEIRFVPQRAQGGRPPAAAPARAGGDAAPPGA